MKAGSRSPTARWWPARHPARCPRSRSRSSTARSCCCPEPRWPAWQDDSVGSLMLLDSASLYFRAFFGVPDTVRAPDGTPVNAVRGLLDTISRLVRARQPERLVACWDADSRAALLGAGVASLHAAR